MTTQLALQRIWDRILWTEERDKHTQDGKERINNTKISNQKGSEKTIQSKKYQYTFQYYGY